MSPIIISDTNSLKSNITYLKTKKSEKFLSSKLLNYVEAVEISGFRKSVFYSQNSTNFNVGDRVYIINGNYDSNELIKKNKYGKGSDGYRVLGCDGCRIIIDIEYTGILPYEDPTDSSFINIYNVTNQREFDWVNSIEFANSEGYISKFDGNIIDGKLKLRSDSIIFLSIELGQDLELGEYYVRSPGGWINVSNYIENNRIEFDSGIENTGKIHIIGEDIVDDKYLRKTLNQRGYFKYESDQWEYDVQFKEAFITKSNFRFGEFSGTHKDGVFGSNTNRSKWSNALWNYGIMINSLWESGVMDSKNMDGIKRAILKNEGGRIFPAETVDITNNNGFGWNFAQDSNFSSGIIKNGNFQNCNFGVYSTNSALDIFFGSTFSHTIELSGNIEKSDVKNTKLVNSSILNTNIINCNISSSKLVNSQVIESSLDKIEVSDRNGIRIISADLWSKTTNTTNPLLIKGILKLYIDNRDLDKLDSGNSFYISRINKEFILDRISSDDKILMRLENRWILDKYRNKEIDSRDIIVSLKTKFNNKFKSYVECSQSSGEELEGGNIITNFSTKIEENNIDLPSIDIEFFGLGFFKFENQWYPSNSSINQLDGGVIRLSNLFLDPFLESPTGGYGNLINKVFTNTYLNNLDIKSGYLTDSKWINGANFNTPTNKIIVDPIRISYLSPERLSITLDKSNSINPDIEVVGEDTLVGDTIWMSSVFDSMGKRIDGRYKVLSRYLNGNDVILEIESKGVTFSFGSFNFGKASTSKYLSINKLQINNTLIKSGLFKGTSIKNSTFYNEDFKNDDKTLLFENSQKLRVVNSIFYGDGNIVKSGIIYKSHYLEGSWEGGILFNSIWDGPDFKGGVSNNVYWLSGTFSGGSFINSNSDIEILDFDGVQRAKSWKYGIFNSGEFISSVWEGGIFNNGRFLKSDWYSGTWSNGILGSKNDPINLTNFGLYGSSVWLGGQVESAKVGGFDGRIDWYGGKFNSGEFTATEFSNSVYTKWHNGDFNGGLFGGVAKWKGGNFFGGKFQSTLGWTFSSLPHPSTQSINYAWEGGKFYGGQFGNYEGGANSTWWNGEFRGGIFAGRLWYNGIFYNGRFDGSGTLFGDERRKENIWNSSISNIGEYNFANSFTKYSTTVGLTRIPPVEGILPDNEWGIFCGLWWNGWVSDTPESVNTNQKVFTILSRSSEEFRNDPRVDIRNILWVSGTFSHKDGVISNSLWLDGSFIDGSFDSSIFNPYVDRSFLGSYSNSSFNTQSSCVWLGGNFNSTFGTGSFYISEWKGGNFNSGYMSGAIWRGGLWNYGTADNIYWESGTWRNGNWNGSPFNAQVISERDKDIVLNINSFTKTNSIHINNGFSASFTEVLINGGINSGQTSSVWYENDNNIAIWQMGSTYSTNGFSIINDSHVYTTGGIKSEQEYLQEYGEEWELQISSPVPGYNWTILGDPGKSNKLYASASGSKMVFTHSYTDYQISLKVSAELTPNVGVNFGIGSNTIGFTFSSNGQTFSHDGSKIVTGYYNTSQSGLTEGINYWSKVWQVNLTYTTPESLTQTDQEFWIEKKEGGILRVLDISIKRGTSTYHPQYNNILWKGISQSGVIYFPTYSFSMSGISDRGEIVRTNFGNGVFRSGLWENGIWNDGWRSNSWFNERDYIRFSNIIGINGIAPYGRNVTIQQNDFNWIIFLQGIDSVIGLKVGDRISIGNIVTIDVNEERRVVNNVFTIRTVNPIDNTISFILSTVFPIRRVERDSNRHLIYVTKNIWLSGAFLNGYFRGVWNSGLIKGFPNISLIEDTHILSGKFDGGRFRTSQISIPNSGSWSTGVVQYFNFIDNNTSGILSTISTSENWKRYISWMDVNWEDVNSPSSTINTESRILKLDSENSINTTAKIENEKNLIGPMTWDILDSNSRFRDSSTQEIKEYKLGTKYKKYENLVPNQGRFTEVATNQSLSSTNNINIDLIGIEKFGWTYSFIPTYQFKVNSATSSTYSGPLIKSNLDNTTSGKLFISITQSQYQNENFYDSYGRFIFSNSEIETIPNRYYIKELNLHTYSFITYSAPIGWSNNLDGIMENYSLNLTDGVNEILNNRLSKVQFFYNIQNLEFSWTTNVTFRKVSGDNGVFRPAKLDLSINSFTIHEVDKIPFFKYASSNNIDNRIKSPYFATAPKIDYSNTNFDFVGNINLTIDSSEISSQNVIVSTDLVDGNSNLGGTIFERIDDVFYS